MVAIGVTGHRFLAEADRLRAGIDRALVRIDARFPGQAWSVISSLAEGADRLVVERVLAYRASAHLVVPLPLPVKEYEVDFTAADSVRDFRRLLGLAGEVIPLPGAASREEAYAASGRYILDHADLLIALWDGHAAQGRGGTGEMVAAARQKGLPVAWVHAGNRRPGTSEPTSLGGEQGQLTLERFP
jgi:hypothetical protein